ncbi:hypothetical protein [Haladaptatus sp. NG-SE-30]
MHLAAVVKLPVKIGFQSAMMGKPYTFRRKLWTTTSSMAIQRESVHNLVRPPFVLQNVWIFATFTASGDNISQFKNESNSAGATYQIISIVSLFDPVYGD